MATQNQRLSICFDLDGTLVDTAPDLIRVLNIVVGSEGLPPTQFKKARNDVGFGAGYLIRQAYTREDRDLTDEKLSELIQMFLDVYADDISQLSKPFSGVETVLGHLKRAGHSLSVCTNKPAYLARPLIEELGMTRWFDRIIGSGEGVPSKPQPEMVFASAGHKDRNRIIMVGDSRADIAAARNARVPVIAVSYGYSDIPAPRLRADKLIRKFGELPRAVTSLGF